MVVIEVRQNDSGQTLIKLLLKHYRGVPASFFYRQIRKGNIKLNGKKPNASVVLAIGDIINVYKQPLHSARYIPSPIADGVPADICYEDENFLVAIKPVGLPSHPAPGFSDSLVDRLIRHLISSGSFDPTTENSFSPALCTRLDTNTSGLVLFAKNAFFLRELNARIAQREVRRFYTCQVVNLPKNNSGTIDLPLYKSDANVSSISTKGKNCLSKYRVLDSDNKLLEVEIITGRSHQIRAHLSSIGCPIVGDVKYGGGKGILRLCCTRLQFCFTYPCVGLEYVNNKVFEHLFE